MPPGLKTLACIVFFYFILYWHMNVTWNSTVYFPKYWLGFAGFRTRKIFKKYSIQMGADVIVGPMKFRRIPNLGDGPDEFSHRVHTTGENIPYVKNGISMNLNVLIVLAIITGLTSSAITGLNMPFLSEIFYCRPQILSAILAEGYIHDGATWWTFLFFINMWGMDPIGVR